jgi:hypothetical protein
MAEIPIRDTSATARTPEEAGWVATGRRLRWGAIFAGLIVAIALQICWTALGLAIGLSSVGPGSSARGTSVGAAIWAIVTAIISLWVGGWTAGRIANPETSGRGALHGFIMWGLSVLLAMWIVSSGAGALAGGVFQLAGNVAGGTVAGATQGAAQLAAGAAGNPNAARRAATRVDSVANATRAQANSTVAAVQEQAGEIATGAKHAATGAAWASFIALILTAAAAAWGGSAAARRRV